MSTRATLCLISLREPVAEGVTGGGVGLVGGRVSMFKPIFLYVASRLLVSSAAVSCRELGSTGSFGGLTSAAVGAADAEAFGVAACCSASASDLLQERQEAPELRLLHGSGHVHVGAPPDRPGVYRLSLEVLRV